MNYNPYAAPQAAPPPQMMQGASQGAAQDWEIGEVLSSAWEILKRSAGTYILAIVVYIVATIAVSIILALPAGILGATGAVEPDSIVLILLQVITQLISFVFSSFMTIGMLRIVLGLVRGETPPLGTLFSGGSRVLTMMAALFLFGLAYVFGIILLVVPGIILGLGLSLTQSFVADTDMGPIEALKASWAATNGYKVKILLFGIVSFFLALAGLIACGVGIIPVAMVLYLAYAIIYVKLSGRGTVVVDGGGGAGFSPMQQPGGYGAPAPAGYGAGPGPGGYGPPGGGGMPPAGGYGPPGGGGQPPPGGGGYGPPGGGGGGGGYGPPGGGGYGPPGGGGYGPPGGGGGGGGGQPPPGGGGGYGPPGGGGYGPPGGQPPGGGGYGPPGGQPPGGGGYGPPGGQPPGGGGYGPPVQQPPQQPYNPGGQPPPGGPYGPPGGGGGGGYNPGGGGQPPPGGGYGPR